MKNASRHSSVWLLIAVVLVLTFSVAFWMGCSDERQGVVDSAADQGEIVLSKSNPQVRAVMAVQDRHTAELMADQEVVGTATGLTADGKLVILVFTKSDITAKREGLAKMSIPDDIEGIPVVIQVTGEIRAYKGKPGSGVSHTAKQDPPIKLGTSGGWRYDLANGYCCGGTLGSLVQKGGKQYILSNWHVLMSDIVDGGNGRTAQAGDPVIQPGLIDVGCNENNAQDVARLEGTHSLPESNVDAAIAEVISGMVSGSGEILEIGTISSSTVAASINQAVKKSGRTTGLTRSKVTGLNATVNITYSNECAGGTAFTKTFTGQLVMDNKGNKFLNSGDSGSLMVENVDTNPRAVGLLYAGSSVVAIANPINDVLTFFGVTMVGK